MSFFAEFSRSNLISSLDLILPLKSLFSRQGSHGWLSSPAFTVHLIEAAQFLLLQIYSHCVCWHRGVLLIQASLNAILDPIMTQMLAGAHDPSDYLRPNRHLESPVVAHLLEFAVLWPVI